MNEALRLLKKTLKPFGYDLKSVGNYTLMPPKHLHHDQLQTTYQAFDQPNQVNTSNLQELTIFIRTCLRSNRNVDTTPRFTGVSLAETVYRCLSSTITAINCANIAPRACKVIVLDDHSDSHYIDILQKIFSKLTCPWELRTTQKTGQGWSLLEQFERAKALDSLCYFCEDDYLHLPSSISEMWDFYLDISNKTHGHMVLHPQEMEFLYNHYYPSYLLKGSTRHWRTMCHATHVLWTHSHVVQQYWPYFENVRFVGNRQKRHLGSEARTTNLLFNHIPGFCPLPGLAGHTQFDFTLPPFFDWQTIWQDNAYQA